jgi:peptidoglycan/LPS O-acetylase OafA/YrhL
MTITPAARGAESAAATARLLPQDAPGQPGPTPASSETYPAIDGLRGLAILSVVAYHSGLYENGMFGVDVFLTLSGFLITLTLTRRHRTGRAATLGRFYGRRAKRILPVAFLTLAGVWVLMVNLGTTTEIARVSQQGIASLFYVANWEQLLRADPYWNGLDSATSLAQMWSLSITEQFYLVWPPLLILALGVRRRSRVGVALLVGVAALAATVAWTAVVFDGANFDRVYLGTDTHAIGLALGCVAALGFWLVRGRAAGRQHRSAAPGSRREARAALPPAAPSPGVRRLRTTLTTLLGIAALAALVGVSVLTPGYRVPWLYPWGMLVVAVLTGVLILVATRPGPLTRLLSFPPLVGIGRASYTLFLIHMPVLWAARRLNPSWDAMEVLLVGGGTSVLLALVIHHLFAEPIRLRRWRAPAVIVVVLAQVALVAGYAGLPATATQLRASGTVRVLTLGDSLANDFATALTQHPGSTDIGVTDAGLGGCGIMSPQATQTPLMPDLAVPTGCLPWQQRWAEQIEAAKPDIVVVDLAWDAVQQKIDGTWSDLADPALQERYRQKLRQVAAIVQRAGVPVLIANSRAQILTTSPEAAAAHSELIGQFVRDHPEVHLLDLNALLCPQGQCATATPAGEPLYIDGVHFTPAGLAYIAPWLEQNIGTALGRGTGDGS